jgi:hypothetical protein
MGTPQKTYNHGVVVGVKVYKRDVVVVREGGNAGHTAVPRGAITEFSYASRQRLAFVAANTNVRFRTMITLTYPKQFPNDGQKVKKDLRKFLTWLRRDTGGCSVLWFLEFQQRGAPHIHILADYIIPKDKPGRQGLRFRVSSAWYRFVDSKDPKHLAAGTRTERIRKVDGAARYAVKYALKMRQKRVPKEYQNVGRFWGCTRDVPPKEPETIRATEDDVRGVLDGWRYGPRPERAVYRVLYGCADRFTDGGCSDVD